MVLENPPDAPRDRDVGVFDLEERPRLRCAIEVAVRGGERRYSGPERFRNCDSEPLETWRVDERRTARKQFILD